MYTRGLIYLPFDFSWINIQSANLLLLPAFVCIYVNHKFVCTITCDLFSIGSLNLNQKWKTPWLRSLLFCGLIDHNHQGHIQLQNQNLPHFTRIAPLETSWWLQAKPEPMLTHHHCESSCNSTEDNSTCSRYHYQKSIRNLHIENYLKDHSVKSLWPHEAIWRHRSGSKLARLTARCMMPPSLCLNQCWLTISMVWWHSLEGIIIRRYMKIPISKSWLKI